MLAGRAGVGEVELYVRCRLRGAGVCYSILRDAELLLWGSGAPAAFRLKEKASWVTKKEGAALFLRVSPEENKRGKKKKHG